MTGGTTVRDAARKAATGGVRRRRDKERVHKASFKDLPSYLKDNEFIETGYRLQMTVRDSVKSLFNVHNETGNIWTHFIGASLSFTLCVPLHIAKVLLFAE
jgi:hypothetical protein